MKSARFPALFLCALLGIPGAFSAPFEEIVVTGTRTPVTAQSLPASVTALNRDSIEALQVKSVPELLRGIAGVDVTSSGGYGKLTGVRMGGLEPDHVLVLINGIRISSATAGFTAFEHLPLAQVERIEIVRGPRSGVWGSDALGGVIHIFTRAGAAETPRYGFTMGAGSQAAFELAGDVSGSYRNLRYSAAASWFDTEGIDARQAVPGPFGFDQPDRDGYDNLALHLRGSYNLGEIGALDAFVLRATGNTAFDGSFQDSSDFAQAALGAALLLQPAARWRTRLQFGEARDELDSFAPAGDRVSRFDTRIRQLSWQNDLSLSDTQRLTLGLDYRHDKVSSSTDYDRAARDSLGLFVQYDAQFYNHRLIASLRQDDEDAFGDKTTGSLGWSYTPDSRLKLYAAYGTAYKTPNFNDLYYPNFSNPALKPETAASFDAGLEAWHAGLWWGLRVYHTDLQDSIVFSCDPVTFECAPQNINKASVTGVAGSLNAQWRNWQALLNVEYLEPRDRTTARRLPRLAQKKLTLALTRDFERFSVGADLLAEGDRFDDAGNTIKLSGYASLDVRAEYRINQSLTVQARLANLLARDYQTIHTYNMLGRNVFLTLRYRSHR